MKRILFVDDEVAVLEGLRNVLRRDRHRWEMEFAESGKTALTMLAQAAFDVLVCDMRMPGMNGLELLERVRQEHPGVVRIALSGYADQEMVAQASSVAHQQLAKPCEREALRIVIERACSLQDQLANAQLRTVLGAVGSLPSAPASYQALTRAIADPAVSTRELAEIVERDMGLASRVIKFVNSAYFGFSRRIGRIDEAIVCIGVNALRHMVLTMEVFGSMGTGFAEYGTHTLERHALLTARIARHIAKDPAKAELAFIAGLLHDAGKLILVSCLPERCAEAIAIARRDGKPLHLAEREAIGADHAEMGAYLLGLWGLPPPVVEAAARHHELPGPAAPVDDVVGAVAIAHALAHHAAAERGDAAVVEPWDAGGAEALAALGGPQLEAWQRVAAEEVRKLHAA